MIIRRRTIVLLAASWVAQACDGAPPRDPPRAPSSAPPASLPVSAGAASASAVGAAASSGSSAATPRTLPPRAPGELPGRTIDYPYDAAELKDRSRAYEGRTFVHDAALAAGRPVPLVVFLHGLNRDLIPHRWMGGGNEGDVRRIAADLIDAGKLPPLVVAGPGSVQKAAVGGAASFPSFDYDRFLELTEAALGGVVQVDRARVVVTGHSGAGCSDRGGLIAAVRAKNRPLAVVSIDTCMAGPLATALGAAPADMHVVVTWQTASWKRDFDRFQQVFAREIGSHPPATGVLRELDHLPPLERAHDATVGQTFAKWLPKLLPPQP